MKRRKFVKTSAAAVGLVSSLEISPLLAATENKSTKTGAPLADNRPSDYLNHVQADPFLPKSPVAGRSYSIPPMPLSERIRQKIVPRRGFCSIAPGDLVSEALTSGNGAMNIELMGDPYSEKILFHHESLLMPWKRPMEAPNIAGIFSQVRQMVLDGKNKEAIALAIQHMNEGPIKEDTEPHLTIPAFLMNLNLPEAASPRNYLRTVNFNSSEIKVIWTDEHGDWLRKTFTSRPDNIVVQWLAAPEGKKMNVRISLQKSAAWTMYSGMDWGAQRGIGTTDPDLAAFVNLASDQKKLAPKGVEACDVRQDSNEQRLIYKCLLDPSVDNSGYAGMTRVVRNGGSARMDGSTLVIENASSIILLTRIEYFPEFSENKVESLRKAVEELTPDYPALLEGHQKVQSEILNRVTVDFGGAPQYGMSTEELLADQLSRPDYSPALLEKIFEMGRHWFILNSGKYPGIAAGINSTINLQTASAVQGDLHEGLEAYFKWMEEIAPDCRSNAKNIFGFRGTSYPLFPDKGFGVNFYYTPNSQIGVWPYWISAGGFCVRQFWDQYLVTGDVEFLRNRVMPIYKELAQFYEDFLTITDKDGNYIFVPSISPENMSRSTDPSGPGLINATMDIAVCREVLTNLIQACVLLGTDNESVTKWKAMLAMLPHYLLELDGTLKEWAWPTLEERYTHRHVAHLYGAWPGNEFDPDLTPQLARAAEIANRRRTFDTMPNAVAGETLAAYGRCHRALIGARLKDNIIVDTQLRQLIEQGYISTALRCSREPYGVPVPDAQGGIPAIMMEMLAYSRPGVIELLPALPTSLVKGSINGMLALTFAKINNLSWDMEARTVDLTITSLRKQDITLIARYGIEDISAPSGVLGEFSRYNADCELHLPENKSVEIHLKLGNHNPLEWVNQTEAQTVLDLTFHKYSPTPPLGWNSWDIFGTTVTEQQVKEQADAMAKHLLASGYKYLTVDIQWYEPESKSHYYNPNAILTMDEYGRLTPGLKKFPSAADGKGFKPLADYVHSKGLKFGIHIMRGIPRQAVAKNTPVLGTNVRAQDIALKNSTCSWNPDMYGVDAIKPEGQTYYNAVIQMYADWGVDYIKVDDISRPYGDVQKAEIEAIRKAIDKTGRPIVLSLSPGATPIFVGEHVMKHANLWRITDDFWDSWGLLHAMFERLDVWTPYRGPGHFPDADMLPIGVIDFNRPTNFTKDEQYMLMSLWAMGRSPLIFGGDMTKLDDFTKEMLTNPEMLKVNQESTNNHQVSRDQNLIVWIADVPNSTDKYVGLFNAQSKGDNIDFANADYASPVIAGAGSSQEISVSVKGGKKLVLFVTDGGNGFDNDHVAWVDPVLQGSKGKLKLTDLKWISATSGWGNANVDKTCEGRPLMVNNQSVSGIGVHSKSVIIYELPEGYDTFSTKGVVTRAQGSVVFGVLVDKGTIDYPDASVVKVDFNTIGIKGKAKVVDLWSHKELGVFNIEFSREIPQHGAGLYRISPVR